MMIPDEIYYAMIVALLPQGAAMWHQPMLTLWDKIPSRPHTLNAQAHGELVIKRTL